MKCYYCNRVAILYKIYTDPVEHIKYDYPHCKEHERLDDHSQEALDLWIKHREELQMSPKNSPTGHLGRL